MHQSLITRNCSVVLYRYTSAACRLHRKRAELVRESSEQPGEASTAKRKKRESPRKKGAQVKKQESSGSESGSDGDSPELSMAHSEVQCI